MRRRLPEIYFFGAISGGAEDIVPWYRPMIRWLERFGTVLSADIFFNPDVLEGQENGLDDAAIWKRDTRYVDRADVLVGDVSIKSEGVGYEIGRAEARGTPILCLFRTTSERRLSPMIAGNQNIIVRRYSTLPGAYGHMTKFFRQIRGNGANI